MAAWRRLKGRLHGAKCKMLVVVVERMSYQVEKKRSVWICAELL